MDSSQVAPQFQRLNLLFLHGGPTLSVQRKTSQLFAANWKDTAFPGRDSRRRLNIAELDNQ